MTIRQLMSVMQGRISDWYDEVSGKARARNQRYIKYAVISGASLIGAALLFGAYQWYSLYRERVAQKDFTLCMDTFVLAQRESQPRWEDVIERCSHAATRNSGSYLYPYFRAVQAEALIKSGDIGQAQQVIEQMRASMRRSDPFFNLFELKYALIQLDNSDEAIKTRGLDLLSTLAHDSANIYADAAQFYLGQYYWSLNETDKAQEEWQHLVENRRAQPAMSSPWAELAMNKVAK